MRPKLRAALFSLCLFPLGLGSCDSLWSSLRGNNPDNCMVNKDLCTGNQQCDPGLERCVDKSPTDGPCSATMPCPMGQTCDLMALVCRLPPNFDLTSVDPRTAFTNSQLNVTLKGIGFMAPITAQFGSGMAAQIMVQGSDTLTAKLPLATQAGPVRVSLATPGGMSSMKDGLFAFAWPTLELTEGPLLDTFSQGPGPVVLADLNNDQRLDVAAVHTDNVSVFLNAATGLGAPVRSAGASTFNAAGVGKFVSGKIDGDAFTDLVLYDPDPVGHTARILLSDGAGGFKSVTPFGLGMGTLDLVAADFDGDQKLDLAVTRSTPDQIQIYAGNGDGTFNASPRASIGVGMQPCALTTGLLHGDALPDLALVHCGSNDIRVYFSSGNFSFGAPQNYNTAIGNSRPARIVIANVDGDQVTDLIVSNASSGSSGHLSVLRGLVSGGFSQPTMVRTTPPETTPIAAADMDGDALPDIVLMPTSLASSFAGPIIFRSDGKGGLSLPQTFNGPSSHMSGFRSFAVGDVNNDNVPDIIYTANMRDVVVMLNTSH